MERVSFILLMGSLGAMMMASIHFSLVTVWPSFETGEFYDGFTGFDLFVRIESIDTQSNLLSIKISIVLPADSIVNNETIPDSLVVGIYRWIPSYAPAQNLTLVRDVLFKEKYYVSGTYTFQIESHRDLYPFDFYNLGLNFYFPVETSTSADIHGFSMPDEVSSMLYLRQVFRETDYEGNNTFATVLLTISRPITYRHL